MNIRKIIEELRNVMYLDFEKRAAIFEEHKSMLQSEIDKNPSNVEAYCVLAMILCELRESIDNSLNVLDTCHTENNVTFSDDEFSLWATNMAYFLIEECEKERELQAVELLKQAVKRNSKYANTYYALAKYYFSIQDYEQASKFFQKAGEISPNKEYTYCEAASLLASSKRDEGILLLKSIYSSNFENEETDARIALTLGREFALKGDIGEAKQIAEVLLKTEFKEFDIEVDEMSDILYILGDYKACVDLYDRCNFYEDSSWLGMYFFSLKQLGYFNIAMRKLDKITNDINLSIQEINPSEWNYEDYEYYLTSEKNRLKEIVNCYNEVFKDGLKPSPDINYDIIVSCYYIDCPRHYETPLS